MARGGMAASNHSASGNYTFFYYYIPHYCSQRLKDQRLSPWAFQLNEQILIFFVFCDFGVYEHTIHRLYIFISLNTGCPFFDLTIGIAVILRDTKPVK